MIYRQLRSGVNDSNYKLIPANESITNHGAELGSQFKDYYTSVYFYNQEQYNKFQQTKSIAGVSDVLTDWLVFDFDAKDEKGNPAPELAMSDTKEMCNRLIKMGVDSKDLRIAFSGSKGFHIEIRHTDNFNPEEHKAIAKQLAEGLNSFDSKVYDHARPFRVTGSLNKTTGLYKIPLTFEELNTLTVSDIKQKASSWGNIKRELFQWEVIDLPKEVTKLKTFKKDYKPKVKLMDTLDIDWSRKPKHIPNCVYALQQGAYVAGERNSASMVVCAWSYHQGESKISAYYACKAAAEQQSLRSGQDKFSKEEIWNNVIEVIYSGNWKGGTYSCRTPGNWRYDYCKTLGEHSCKHDKDDVEVQPIRLRDLKEDFKNYVKTIQENTILTGLPSLDKEVFLSTGANVMVIGAAGSGKTSIGIEILNNTSKAGVLSVCASLDMAKNRLFEKIMYRLSGYDRSHLYEIFKNDEEDDLMKKLDEEFGNVYFFKKSSPTVADIKSYVLELEKQTERKVKLLVVDYLERVSSQFSEDTAASKDVAGDLQDLVDDLDICLITLVQPNKNALSGGPDNPIYDYTKIKGSSFVYQSARIIISAWRPFYNPKDFSNDKFMQMAILKNDLGELAELSFGWNGKRGIIKELEDNEHYDLRSLLDKKEADKNANKQRDLF